MDKRPLKLYSVFICGVFCALFSYFLSKSNVSTTQELAQHAETLLHSKETLAKAKLDVLSNALKTIKPKSLFLKYQDVFFDLYKKEGIALYVYQNDSLCFWSDNQPSIELNAYTNETNVQLIKIRNGWFEYIKQKDTLNSNYSVIALITLKPEYDFENRYLNNNFSEWLQLPENTKLGSPVTYLNHAVKSKFGPPLFEIYRTEGLYKSESINTTVCFLYTIACLLFLATLFLGLRQIIKTELSFILAFGVLSFLIRSFMIYFKLPNAFYYGSLYDAKLFGDASSFYFSYLGDILINCGLLFLVAALIYKTEIKAQVKNKLSVVVILLVFFACIVFFSFKIRLLTYSLVNNSTISYNINELFNFSVYSLIGLLSVGLLIFAFYLFIEKIIILLLYLPKNYSKLIRIVVFIATLACVAIPIYNIYYLEYFWPAVLVLMSYFLRKFKATYNFINIGLIVLVATFIVSSLFSKYEQVNKKQTFEALSLTLTDRQDVVAENEFSKISANIKSDAQIKNLLTLLPLSTEQIEQSLRQINFSGYFERYDIIMSLFKHDCTPVFIDLNPVYLNEDYFKQQIESNGFQTICDDLYFIDKVKKSVRYIAKIDIEDFNKNPTKTFHLYLQLEPKLATNLGAFPDLLLDKSLENKLETKQISYAVYESNKLMSTFGDYQYPLMINSNTFKNSTNDSYEHFLYPSKNNSKIIISEKEFGLWGRFTTNSYLFIFLNNFFK